LHHLLRPSMVNNGAESAKVPQRSFGLGASSPSAHCAMIGFWYFETAGGTAHPPIDPSTIKDCMALKIDILRADHI
jgi:hypothetical protein